MLPLHPFFHTFRQAPPLPSLIGSSAELSSHVYADKAGITLYTPVLLMDILRVMFITTQCPC